MSGSFDVLNMTLSICTPAQFWFHYSYIVLPSQVWFGFPLCKIPWGNFSGHCPRGWHNRLCCPYIPWGTKNREIQMLSAQGYKDANDISPRLSASNSWVAGSTCREVEHADIQHQCHQLYTWRAGCWIAEIHSQIGNGVWIRWKTGHRWVISSWEKNDIYLNLLQSNLL